MLYSVEPCVRQTTRSDVVFGRLQRLFEPPNGSVQDRIYKILHYLYSGPHYLSSTIVFAGRDFFPMDFLSPKEYSQISKRIPQCRKFTLWHYQQKNSIAYFRGTGGET
jgi:hypothetical protein